MTSFALAPVSFASVAWSGVGETGFVVALFAGSKLLPGRVEKGVCHADGSQITYRLNGLALFVLVLAAAALAQAIGPGLAPLARQVWSLFIAANVLAILASTGLFLVGRDRRSAPALDFFYGVDRDPSLLGIDLKMFSYRPSLIGLALMNLACVSSQYQTTGRLGLPISLYAIFTLLYIANYFQFEYGMLHTWDIIEERFGAMLVWGDYALVPFFYAMPAFYVATRKQPSDWRTTLAITLAYALGFWMFRGANEQKHRFKRDPHTRIWGRRARSLQGRLLISGFWGIGRKMNYTGELTMYVAWCALAGTNSLVPYILPAFLAVLLVHRASRDDRRCRAKYGALWVEYCAIARFRMFPLIENLGLGMAAKLSEIDR